MDLKVRKLSDKAILPTQANPGDAGWDIYAVEDVCLPVGNTVEIKTDVAFEIPEGHFGLVATRSSYGIRGISVHPGIIDSGYRGEVSVFARANEESYQVAKGDRVAQLLIIRIPTINMVEVKELADSVRGTKRLGSSGK